MYKEWKNKKSIYVTPETIVPTRPKEILVQPDDVTYHKAQVELDEHIDKLAAQLKEQSSQFDTQLKDMSVD